jgi:hypothetical protein
MKTFLNIIVAALLVLSVTPAARAEKNSQTAARTAAPTAAALAAKKPFLWGIFSRERKAQAVAPEPAARPKPKPNVNAGTRRSSGQRSSRNASATTAATATASVKVTPTEAAPAAPADNVLAKPPAAVPVETDRLQRQYSPKTTLGRAMRGVLEDLEDQSTQPTEVVKETVVARVTAFHAGDANSAAGKTNTPGVKLQKATETQIGVAAGPAELLGSYAIVTIDGKEYRYLIADVGSAVEKRTASNGKATVIDLYAPGGQRWESYKPVELVKITGAAHMLLQDVEDRGDFLRGDVFRRALHLARRG